MANTSQQEFETWASGRGLNTAKAHQSDEYQSKGTRELWWCWQASREALGARLVRQMPK
ncbi:UNVERIFIED_ORG: hypothetical protein J2Y77_005842 [Pseudomonas lini]